MVDSELVMDSSGDPGTDAAECTNEPPAKKQKRRRGSHPAPAGNTTNGRASNPKANENDEDGQPRWSTCEVLAAAGSYLGSSEIQKEQRLEDLDARCNEQYGLHSAELDRQGRWDPKVPLDESVARRAVGSTIRRKVRRVGQVISRDILPLKRAIEVGGKITAAGNKALSGETDADVIAQLKEAYFEKWKKGRKRGVPTSVNDFSTPEWVVFLEFKNSGQFSVLMETVTSGRGAGPDGMGSTSRRAQKDKAHAEREHKKKAPEVDDEVQEMREHNRLQQESNDLQKVQLKIEMLKLELQIVDTCEEKQALREQLKALRQESSSLTLNKQASDPPPNPVSSAISHPELVVLDTPGSAAGVSEKSIGGGNVETVQPNLDSPIEGPEAASTPIAMSPARRVMEYASNAMRFISG